MKSNLAFSLTDRKRMINLWVNKTNYVVYKNTNYNRLKNYNIIKIIMSINWLFIYND